MIGEEDEGRVGDDNRRNYLRSVSWTERSPRKGNTSNQVPGKGRPCFPPLPPLSIARQSVEEWPKAGNDDLGVWPCPQTPRGGVAPTDNSASVNPVKEFEFKKDELAFFNKECSRIADHVYLGSDAVAKNREVLKQNGITHVLNCVGFVCAEYFKSDFVYKTLWLRDSPLEDITSILYDVFDYFEDVCEQGGRVFVHCCQGISRSSSLVIAYLMWREGQSFEDAFQFVKTVRGVTNPNLGFACQLLECQKRVHAVPASPKSELRIFRMAPHSPYDPLHLVPKLLDSPIVEELDSRGAFIVHVPSAIYVWTGKNCSSVMSNHARATAFQVVRYERAKGPIMCIKEDEEPLEFWDAFASGQHFLEGKEGKVELKKVVKDTVVQMNVDGTKERRIPDYNSDFEIFSKALAGGVVPPFSVSSTQSETCLPARENGWSKLRRKFVNGFMKELVIVSLLNCDRGKSGSDSKMIIDAEIHVSPTNTPMSTEIPVSPTNTSVSAAKSDSSQGLNDSFSNSIPDTIGVLRREVERPHPLADSVSSTRPCNDLAESIRPYSFVDPSLSTSQACSDRELSDFYSCGSPNSISACKEVGCNSPLSDTLSPTPYSSSNSSFSFLGGSSKFSSSSPTLSPSMSDYSSSLTFSPSSSNWSNLSSRQPSPTSQEFIDQFYPDNALLLNRNSCLPNKETPPSPKDTFSPISFLQARNISFPCKGVPPSIAERRGGNPPSRMFIPMVDEPSQSSSRKSRRPCPSSPPDMDDAVMKDANCN